MISLACSAERPGSRPGLAKLVELVKRARRHVGSTSMEIVAFSSLVAESLARSGAIRMDLISSEEAEPLYRRFRHERWPGYRLFPDG
jgi:hypothetical protein